MARTVQLSEKAYASLKAHKRPNESFSDEVLRLLGERKDPMKLLEIRLEPDAEETLAEMRRITDEETERRFKERGA